MHVESSKLAQRAANEIEKEQKTLQLSLSCTLGQVPIGYLLLQRKALEATDIFHKKSVTS